MEEQVRLSRDCDAVQIPAGHTVSLPKGTVAVITQSLGGTYTLQVPSLGGLYRVAGKDGDALGRTAASGQTPRLRAIGLDHPDFFACRQPLLALTLGGHEF